MTDSMDSTATPRSGNGIGRWTFIGGMLFLGLIILFASGKLNIQAPISDSARVEAGLESAYANSARMDSIGKTGLAYELNMRRVERHEENARRLRGE